MEIRTSEGLTGLLIVGTGYFEIPGKSMSDSFNICMMRFNPADFDKLVTVTGNEKLEDEGFKTMAVRTTATFFRHCYHRRMDAFIPGSGAFALNFDCKKYGDLLTSFDPLKKLDIVYSFTSKRRY